MKPLVTFKWLWLLSERDMSARHLVFSPRKNLLAGGNSTGKSRVLKHLTWVLGAEPVKRAAGEFDSNVVAAARVQVGQRELTLVRHNKRRAAFDSAGALLCVAQDSREWNKYFASEFSYELQLQRHEEGKFDYAGPGYALLPFYVDQDGGWGTKWAGFSDLGQFASWQKSVFEFFTGLKPARYAKARLARDTVAFQLKEARLQQRLQDESFRRVVEMLPAAATAVLDGKAFAKELRDISARAENLTVLQEDTRTQILDLAQEREQKRAELRLALRSEKELVEDLAYLAGYKDGEILVCPTCGQEHGIEFKARLNLADDAKNMHELAVKLQRQIESFATQEQKLRETLGRVTFELRELNIALSVKQKDNKVGDIVAAKSRETLDRAYEATRRQLAAQLDELENEKRALDAELAALSEKSREQRVRDHYKEQFRSFADKLNIHGAELGSRATTIGARPPSATGSNLPRAVLATHLALLACHRNTGNGPSFPLMVDTPQQSGQDMLNLASMLQAILDAAPENQTMVAVESIPEAWSIPDDCKVHEFSKKRGLLREAEFKDGISALSFYVQKMNEALKDRPEIKATPLLESADGQEDDDDDDDEGHN